MANRCPSCEKFVSLKFGEPEVESLEIEGDEVKCAVRLTMVCAECNDEMREYHSEMSMTLGDKLHNATDYDEHFDDDGNGKSEDCELTIDEDGVEQVDKTEKRKTLYGAEVHFSITCGCGKAPTFVEDHLESDYVSSSEMEECC